MLLPSGYFIEYAHQLVGDDFRPFAGMAGSHINEMMIFYNLTGRTYNELKEVKGTKPARGARAHWRREKN